MNKHESILGIALVTFAILFGVTQNAYGQGGATSAPSATNASAAAPQTVEVDLFDTRDNSKYTYTFPVDPSLQDKISSLVTAIIGSGAVSPTGVENVPQNEYISNQSAAIASLYGFGPGGTSFLDDALSVVNTGVKIGSALGPLIGLFGPGDDYYQ